jgi:hypothetical protein
MWIRRVAIAVVTLTLNIGKVTDIENNMPLPIRRIFRISKGNWDNPAGTALPAEGWGKKNPKYFFQNARPGNGLLVPVSQSCRHSVARGGLGKEKPKVFLSKPRGVRQRTSGSCFTIQQAQRCLWRAGERKTQSISFKIGRRQATGCRFLFHNPAGTALPLEGWQRKTQSVSFKIARRQATDFCFLFHNPAGTALPL